MNNDLLSEIPKNFIGLSNTLVEAENTSTWEWHRIKRNPPTTQQMTQIFEQANHLLEKINKLTPRSKYINSSTSENWSKQLRSLKQRTDALIPIYQGSWRRNNMLAKSYHQDLDSKMNHYQELCGQADSTVGVLTQAQSYNQSFISLSAQLKEKFIINVEMMSQKIQSIVHLSKKETTEDLIKLLQTINQILKENERELFEEIGELIIKAPKEAFLFSENVPIIKGMVEEIVKVTNSIIYMSMPSVNDANSVFYTIAGDDENLNTNDDISLDALIGPKTILIQKMIKDCNKILSDSRNLQQNMPKLMVAYMTLLEEYKICENTLNVERELAQEYDERLERYETDPSRYKDFITKIQAKKKELPLTMEKFETILKPMEELKTKLMDLHLIDDSHSFLNPTSITLTNPILEGKYTLSDKDLFQLSKSYSSYLSRLRSFQKICAETCVNLDKLVDKSIYV